MSSLTVTLHDISGMHLAADCYAAHPLQDRALQIPDICVAFFHQLFSILAAPQASSAAPVTWTVIVQIKVHARLGPVHNTMHLHCTIRMHLGAAAG